MFKPIFILILIISHPIMMIAQENEEYPMNSVQFELGGHGVSYSLNYERFLINGKGFKLSAQAGASYNPEFIGIIELWIPMMLNQLYPVGNHYIESGIGVVPHYSSFRGIQGQIVDWEWNTLLSARVGFRFQHATKPCFLRVAYTPFFEPGLFIRKDGSIGKPNLRSHLYSWLGIGIGYNF